MRSIAPVSRSAHRGSHWAALCALHELLVACESRLVSADGNIVMLCLDASRLARNGRDWHHLLELCGLVEARVIDLDGVYDPCRPDDRLLLGMKGSISEFELGIIRSRMYEAARSKAKRGELRISIPIGYIWDRHVGLGLDPDRRLQEVIRLVFEKVP
jgi:DNA invertase Pin-like site-specific DNA recombinase